MPTPIPQNSSLTTDKDSQKTDDRTLKQQTSNISKNQVKADENGGSSNSRATSNPGQQLSSKSSTQSSKITTNNPTDEAEYDDDGGINPNKIIKQKQKAEENKRIKDDLKKEKKSKITDDLVDEDGSMLKHKHKVKEPKTKKKSMFTQCFQEQGEGDSASKQKVLPTEKKKIIEDSDDDDDDEDGGPKRKKIIQKKTSNKSNTLKKDEDDNEDEDGGRIPILKTHDTIKMIIPSKQPKLVPIEEKHAVRTTVTDSSPLNCQNVFNNKMYHLRSISYCKAQQHSPELVSRKHINSSLLRSQNNTNDHDSRLHSIIKLVQSLSEYSSNQQKLIKRSPTESLNEKRRKIARTRWFLAFTIIHNPWLSKLRKRVLLEEKLRLQCSQQRTQLNRQVVTPATIDQKSITTANNMESETLRMRRMRTKTKTSLDTQPPTALRLLPMPNTDDDSQSSIKKSIIIHSQVLNNANTQRATTSHSTTMRQALTKIDVLPQKNTSSSVPRIQISHNQHMQTQHIHKVQKV